MKVALGADDSTHTVEAIADFLQGAGHEVTRFGKAADATSKEEWGETARKVAEAVTRGAHELGVVCCWTGTGVSMAASKVPGARAALCVDAETARGARKWNDANILALSLRLTSVEVAREILKAWLEEPYGGTEGASLSVLSTLDGRR